MGKGKGDKKPQLSIGKNENLYRKRKNQADSDG